MYYKHTSWDVMPCPTSGPLKVPAGSSGLGDGVASGFLQVGEWSYPLVKATSPVLHSFYGAYMFPDPSNSIPGEDKGGGGWVEGDPTQM